jgi:signal transduction histidine kinase
MTDETPLTSQRITPATTLILGVGVPLAVLAYLAMGSIEKERGEEIRAAEDRASRAATAVAQGFDALLWHLEEALLHRARDGLARLPLPEPPDEELEPGVSAPPSLNARGRAVATGLEALESEDLVRETFCISRSGRLVWPRVIRRPPPTQHPQDPSWVKDRDQVVSALAGVESAPDLDSAETDLQPALHECKDESLLCVLQLKHAELLVRRGDPERALPVLDQVRSRDSARDLAGEPIAPDALRRYAEVAQKLHRPDDAIEALVSLAQALAEDRWLEDSVYRRDLLEAVVADARVIADVMPLKDTARERRALERAVDRAAFLDSFEERILPELRRRMKPPPQDDALGTPVRLGLDVLGESRLFLAAPLDGSVTREVAVVTSSVRPRGEPPVAVVGLEVELARLRDRLETDIAQVQSTTEARLAVVDEMGSHVAGDVELAGDTAQRLGRPLSDALPGWRVLAVPRDPGAPERLARNRLLLSGALVATCALAAALSFFVALRATSRELEVARVRSDLVRNVSHELRTPVASVLMLSEVLEEGGLPTEKQSDYVGRIAREARRLSRLIENVLDLARVERGARRVELQGVALGETVAQATSGFLASEEGRGAHVEITDPAPETIVPHDPAALEQVVQNLVSNAVKYSAPGEPVAVTVAYGPLEARVSVADRGRGLAAEEQRRLFTPFYRARPEHGETVGTGLGLVITRELVRLHGGRLEVESAPGKGSTFTVVLLRA